MTKQLPVPDNDLIERLRDYERRLKAVENRGSASTANLSVPGVPTFGAYTTTFYQGPSDGKTKAAIQLTWSVPTNTDGSAIVDGSYYEIRWRATVLQLTATRWGGLASHRWGELDSNTWGNPLGSFSTVTSDWHYIRVTWDVTQFSVQELTPGVGYEFQIRAVDTGQIPNLGAWSATLDVVAAVDTIAPPQPAAPAVAASLIAVQVTHTLGLASGGTYNLPPDLHHMEVHGGTDPTFLPSTSTLLGKLIANAGLLTAQIPAVGTFPTSSTAAVYVKVIAVDVTGNKSEASPGAPATATLIDNAHISDLSVSKLTAGTIGADMVVGARIKTADAGARVELNTAGLQAYDSSGTRTVNISSADGSASLTGSVITIAAPGDYVQMSGGAITLYNANTARLALTPALDGGTDPAVVFTSTDGTNRAVVQSESPTPSSATLELLSGTFDPGDAILRRGRLQFSDSLLDTQLATINDATALVLGGFIELFGTGVEIGYLDEEAGTFAGMNVYNTGQIVIEVLPAGSSPAITAALTSGTVTGNRALGFGLFTDTFDSFSLDFDGKMQWGPGGLTDIDTNLYRAGVATLKTDSDLQLGGRLTGIRELSQAATAGITLTTSYQDVTGATLTFNTAVANTVAIVTIQADASWGGSITIGDTIIATINTDGTDDNSKSAIIVGTGSSFNGAAFGASCTYILTLAAAGSHTIKMRAKRTASGTGSGSANINAPNARGATIPGGTVLSILVLGG